MLVRWFQSSSLRLKIVFMLVAVLLVSLGIGFVIVIYTNNQIARTDANENATQRTKLIADYSAATLSFNDVHGAREVLSKLEGTKEALAGFLYDAQGQEFARYIRSSVDENVAQEFFKHPIGLHQNVIRTEQEVLLESESIGKVVLFSSTKILNDKIRKFTLFMITLFVGVAILSAILVYRFQDYVSRPILKLAEAARAVSKSGSYEIALAGDYQDEIGDLYRNFNEMLSQIQAERAERDSAEQALRESESRYRAIVQDQTDFICRFDKEGIISFANQAYCDHYNLTLDELVSTSIYSLVHEDDRALLKEEIAQLELGREVNHSEHRVVKPDGVIRFHHWINRALFDETGAIVQYQGVGRDITQERQAEKDKAEILKKLHNSQRLETIGTLAGGIAHDFNNILTPISGYLFLADQKIPSDSEAKGYIKTLSEATERAKGLVEQILTFSRSSPLQKREPVSLEDLIHETVKLLRATVPRSIEFRVDLQVSGGFVLADKSQLHQILMNLCTNAFQAISDEQGVITITLRQMEGGAVRAEGFHLVEEETYFYLEVADSGSGMPADVVERIFEPFYTTKPIGKGTGLGLSVVHGLVSSFSGEIIVDSEVGKGSKFKIILPVYTGEADQDSDDTKELQRGTERLLFVDDEEPICQLGQDMLEYLGYTVEAHSNPEEAFDYFSKNPEIYDLVITDHTMPGLTGVELAGRIRSICTDVPVILTTGYGGEKLQKSDFFSQGIVAVLQKPYGADELSGAIREALGQRA